MRWPEEDSPETKSPLLLDRVKSSMLLNDLKRVTFLGLAEAVIGAKGRNPYLILVQAKAAIGGHLAFSD